METAVTGIQQSNYAEAVEHSQAENSPLAQAVEHLC